jgi:hypothetical protein
LTIEGNYLENSADKSCQTEDVTIVYPKSGKNKNYRKWTIAIIVAVFTAVTGFLAYTYLN